MAYPRVKIVEADVTIRDLPAETFVKPNRFAMSGPLPNYCFL